MNGRLVWWKAFGVVLTAALILAACGGGVSTPTVKASGNSCTYEGPRQVPAKMTLTWDVTDSTPSMDYSFIVVPLREGKTEADLQPLIGVESPELPSWFSTVKVSLLVHETRTEDLDLSVNGSYHGEPLYVFCLSHEVAYGLVGPIEVKE
jgi:hypothetical protein